jgi:hypothetical protein
VKAALRHDSNSHAAKALRRSYMSHVRRNRRRWTRARIEKLKDDLKHCPRKFWKTARVQRAAKIIGDLEGWQGYLKKLLGTPVSASTTRHGAGLREGVPSNTELNEPFDEAELSQALKSLRGSKAADVFGLKAEVLKDLLFQTGQGADRQSFFTLIPHITHVFNLVLASGQLPEAWCQGCVHPVAKVESPADYDDYRCITVGSVLGKLFSMALDRRLNNHLEQNNLRSPAQGGFRQGFNTSDQAFVLNHIIDKAKHKKSQVYCAFVDFRKAFDTVRHEHLWDRLQTYGVDGAFLACVQSLYAQSQACVSVNGALTGYEKLLVGVRQGDPLSPTLFGIYIEILDDDLRASMAPMDTLAVGGVPVFSLLYADDLVLIAASPEALQKELDILGKFCQDWDLEVNYKKTKTVVFHPRKGDAALSWTLNNKKVDTATRYTYLGLIFDDKKGLRPAPGPLVDAGRRALFGMMGICSQQEISDPSLRHHMFKALVLPVLSYGAELWGGFTPSFLSDDYFAAAHAEKVHTLFLRWFTGAARSTHRRVLTQAAGAQLLGAHWDSRTSAFWNRLVAMPGNRLARLAFKDDISLMRRGGQCWASRAVEHFSELGALGQLAINHPVTPLWDHQVDTAQGISESTAALFSRYRHNPRTLPAQPVRVPDRTMFTFASWFLQLTDGIQVHHNIPSKHWRAVLSFCTGRHVLESRGARWHKTPPHLCICPICGGAPEDEAHLVLECPAYSHLRQQHPAVFGGMPSDICDAMRHVFQPAHFLELSQFLSACFRVRSDFVAKGGRVPRPPEPDPDFGSQTKTWPWILLAVPTLLIIIIFMFLIVLPSVKSLGTGLLDL